MTHMTQSSNTPQSVTFLLIVASPCIHRYLTSTAHVRLHFMFPPKMLEITGHTRMMQQRGVRGVVVVLVVFLEKFIGFFVLFVSFRFVLGFTRCPAGAALIHSQPAIRRKRFTRLSELIYTIASNAPRCKSPP